MTTILLLFLIAVVLSFIDLDHNPRITAETNNPRVFTQLLLCHLRSISDMVIYRKRPLYLIAIPKIGLMAPAKASAAGVFP